MMIKCSEIKSGKVEIPKQNEEMLGPNDMDKSNLLDKGMLENSFNVPKEEKLDQDSLTQAIRDVVGFNFDMSQYKGEYKFNYPLERQKYMNCDSCDKCRQLDKTCIDTCWGYFMYLCETNDVECIPQGPFMKLRQKQEWFYNQYVNFGETFGKSCEKLIEKFVIYDDESEKYVLVYDELTEMLRPELKNFSSNSMKDLKVSLREHIDNFEKQLNNFISQGFIHLFGDYLFNVLKFVINNKLNGREYYEIDMKFIDNIEAFAKNIQSKARKMYNGIFSKMRSELLKK
jgi:hypothetical protein